MIVRVNCTILAHPQSSTWTHFQQFSATKESYEPTVPNLLAIKRLMDKLVDKWPLFTGDISVKSEYHSLDLALRDQF